MKELTDDDGENRFTIDELAVILDMNVDEIKDIGVLQETINNYGKVKFRENYGDKAILSEMKTMLQN